ncbi:hypothetical protein ILYODFUR_034731 [Ilyodon furcidens]|uniref:Uncharacterized protein n=1 Tax=Ilyodon furcidens TaxID=33524 RepID=A0ABV0UDV2_9TELE
MSSLPFLPGPQQILLQGRERERVSRANNYKKMRMEYCWLRVLLLCDLFFDYLPMIQSMKAANTDEIYN